MTEHTYTAGDSASLSDTVGHEHTQATEETPATLADFAAGEEAPADLYVVHSVYTMVPELDPETGQVNPDLLVQIEQPYETDRYALELGENERGNVLLAKGTVVTDELAASIGTQLDAG